MQRHFVAVAKGEGGGDWREYRACALDMALEELAELVMLGLEFGVVGDVLVAAAGAYGGARGERGLAFGDRQGEGAGGGNSRWGGFEEGQGFRFDVRAVIPDEFGLDGFVGQDAGDEADFPLMPGNTAATVSDLVDMGRKGQERVVGSGLWVMGSGFGVQDLVFVGCIRFW
jgi:hypothetical protein